MHIYNVTIHVEEAIREKWLQWIKEVHIPEMLQTGKFYSAKLCKVLVDEETGGTTYAVQYGCPDLETLRQYYREDAEKMRKDGTDRFGDKMVAFRTELEVLDDKIALPEPATTHLFVYGTLLDHGVQEMVFSRKPEMLEAEISGFVKRENQVAGRYPDLDYTAEPGDVVKGQVLVLNKHELPLVDHYEGRAYQRVEVVLKTGVKAWVYVNANARPS